MVKPMSCIYCVMDSAGNHQDSCPLKVVTPPTWTNYGWICPACGGGNAPWVAHCGYCHPALWTC